MVDQSILIPLLPVAFMFLFVIMYFILYANFLQKLCTGSWYCGNRRNRLPLGQWRRNGASTSSADFDETYIQLKGQITRIALAEAEALRLAKILAENNEHDAKEYIANLRMTMFPFGLTNAAIEQTACSYSSTQINTAEELPPPRYDECV